MWSARPDDKERARAPHENLLGNTAVGPTAEAGASVSSYDSKVEAIPAAMANYLLGGVADQHFRAYIEAGILETLFHASQVLLAFTLAPGRFFLHMFLPTLGHSGRVV